jgi:thiol-disulfide isomerase/thioredoxin
MSVATLEFVQLEQKLRKAKKVHLDLLAPELGKAYVVAICREGCPNCEEQKPKLNKLATKIAQKHGDKVVFTRVHVKYAQNSKEESARAKDVFHHYFYPTNLILIRSRDKGAFELYRNAGPEMIELEKNIESAVETAAMLAKED